MVVSYNDIFNPLEGKKEELIALFVKFYGEKYREKIINAINNIEFIFIDNSDETGIKISNFYSSKKNEIAKQFCNEVKLEGYKNISGELFEHIQHCLENKKYDYYLREFINKMGFKGSVEEVLQQDNYEFIDGRIKQLQKVWNSKYKDRYCELEEEAKKYFKFFEDEEKTKVEIRSECEGNIINYLRNNENISYEDDYELAVLKESLRDLHSIGKERLNDEFAVGYNKARFIRAFKMFGYDYGDDYNRYINDPNLMNCVFDKGLVDYIHEQKKQREIKIMRNRSMFMSAVKQIEQLDIKGGNWSYITKIFNFSQGAMGSTSAYCTAYVNSKNELKHIIVCPLGINLSTRTFIHEVGHAICSNLISVNDNGFTYKSGYVTHTNKFSYKNFNDDEFFNSLRPGYKDLKDMFREFTLINEVLHDYIMLIVACKAESEGIAFGLEGVTKSTYMHALPMIEDFARKNRRLIKLSQIDEDPMMFAKHIGMANFKKLAKAIHICVTLYEEVYDEYVSKIKYNKMRMFEVAHLKYDWSPKMREFLDAYLDAEEVFDSFNKSQQLS